MIRSKGLAVLLFHYSVTSLVDKARNKHVNLLHIGYICSLDKHCIHARYFTWVDDNFPNLGLLLNYTLMSAWAIGCFRAGKPVLNESAIESTTGRV